MKCKGKVYVCDACGYATGGIGEDDRPANLLGLVTASGAIGTGIMGTVEVDTGDGRSFETKPFYAHRAACLRKAIENVMADYAPNPLATDEQ